MSVNRRLAVITGASSGIGEVYARRLAAMGLDLLITARREEKLRRLKMELEDECGISVKVVVADLSRNEDISKLVDIINNINNIYYLVNNAGYTILGNFHDVEIQRYREMMKVHMDAPTEFTHTVLPQMMKRDEGVIINVASVAGLTTKSRFSLYGSTKTYIVHFSKFIRKMLNETNIIVQALCPGFTYSGFHKTEEFLIHNADTYNTIPKFLWLRAEDVVDSSLKKLSRKRVVHVPSLRYRVILRLVNLGILKF